LVKDTRQHKEVEQHKKFIELYEAMKEKRKQRMEKFKENLD